ncbi:uncharacterized protein LOC144783224 isoform X1 [Lissotriton helveticus]
MKLMLAISLFAVLSMLFGQTDSAVMDKSDSSDFLRKIRKRRDDRSCTGGKCALEDDGDVFDDRAFGEELLHFYLFRTLLQRMNLPGKHQAQYSKMMDSASESRMMSQEPLLTSLPPDRTSN